MTLKLELSSRSHQHSFTCGAAPILVGSFAGLCTARWRVFATAFHQS